ncbi:MAG: ABC transporter permease [Spirochaetia bacterium]
MKTAIVARRELRSAFNSPIAYIVAVAYLVFTSVWIFFLNQFFARNEASLRLYFGIVPIVFVFLVPALTMRSWAEERRMGTLEVLLTLPFREREVVLGKFLGSFGLLLAVILLSLPLPVSLSRLGDFDWGQIAGQYLGVLFIGAAGVSVGLFVSALSTNQVAAFILTGLALLALTLAGQLPAVASLPGWLSEVLRFLSFGSHYDSFDRGMLDSRDVLYFLLAVVLFLYLNIRVLVGRKSA